ncbi:hypothetical protein IHE61_30250 [Streptomyces sp. GKU 257-1]|nr:hypothetical protein [Streptomyces sp. GKU 257-1]
MWDEPAAAEGLTGTSFPVRPLAELPPEAVALAGEPPLESLCRAWEAGAAPDWTAVFAARPGRGVVLPTYPFETAPYRLDDGAAGPARRAGTPRSRARSPHRPARSPSPVPSRFSPTMWSGGCRPCRPPRAACWVSPPSARSTPASPGCAGSGSTTRARCRGRGR